MFVGGWGGFFVLSRDSVCRILGVCLGNGLSVRVELL